MPPPRASERAQLTVRRQQLDGSGSVTLPRTKPASEQRRLPSPGQVVQSHLLCDGKAPDVAPLRVSRGSARRRTLGVRAGPCTRARQRA